MLNILLPLDGSDLAERAIPHALTVARPFDSSITLLRVVTPTEFRSQDTFSRVDWRLHKHQALAYLQGVARTFEASDVACEVCVKEGRPAEVIVETARELETQLLVVSTHGRGAAVDFPRGGVASKVLSAFGASVLLVAGRSAMEPERQFRYQRMFVPVDGSYRSECALRVAIMLAEALGAQLIVACITEEPVLPYIVRHDRKAALLCRELADLARAAAERRLGELKAQIPAQIPLHTSVLLARQPAEAIAEAVRRTDADLLIASKNFLDRSLTASVSYPADTQVPMLALSPDSIGDAFCKPRITEGSELTNADVS